VRNERRRRNGMDYNYNYNNNHHTNGDVYLSQGDRYYTSNITPEYKRKLD
jgi:hypothetical protein